MSKDKLATIFGAVAGVAMLLGQLGVSIGHIGTASGNEAVAAVATVLLGYVANKK